MVHHSRQEKGIVQLQIAGDNGALGDPEHPSQEGIGTFEPSPVKLIPIKVVSDADTKTME